MLAVLVAGIAMVVAPATARAADHLVLRTEAAPFDLSAAPAAVRARLGRWRVSLVAEADQYTDWFPGSPVPVATEAQVSARLISVRRGVRETHDVAAVAPVTAIVFDGVQGTLAARNLGPIAVLDLRIVATGPPSPVAGVVCPPAGTLATVPVRVDGLVEIRTGTRYFGTVAAHAFSGKMTYNPAGPGASCEYPPAPLVCFTERVLDSYPLGSPSVQAAWVEDEGTVTVEAWNGTWGHVLSVSSRRSPFVGPPGRLRVRLPAPLRGSLVFRATRPVQPVGACSGSIVLGALSGRIEARFHGFGLSKRVFHGEGVGFYRQP